MINNKRRRSRGPEGGGNARPRYVPASIKDSPATNGERNKFRARLMNIGRENALSGIPLIRLFSISCKRDGGAIQNSSASCSLEIARGAVYSCSFKTL